jgi:tetratricopeptide (TPR) repeat protein
MYLPVAAVLVGLAAAVIWGLRKLDLRETTTLDATGQWTCRGVIAALAVIGGTATYYFAQKNAWFPAAAACLGAAAFMLQALRSANPSKDGGLGPIGATVFGCGLLWVTLSLAFISYWRNDDYLTDSKLYGHIPKVFPWNERGCNNYAKICIDEGRIDEAEVLLNQALRIDPEYSDAFTNRGIIFHRRTQYDRAIANATEAIRWNPLNPSAWNNRGNALIELKMFDEAIADFTHLTVMNPRGVEGWYGRANTYFIWGKHDNALEDIQNVIQRSPGDYKAFNTKGNILKQQGIKLREKGEQSQAVARFRDAVTAFNTGVDLVIREARSASFPNLAAVEEVLLGKLERHQLAMTFGNRFTLATILGNRADAYRQLMDEGFPNAKNLMFDDLTRAILMHPETPNYFLVRGQQHFNLKTYPQALADFDEALRRQPNNIDGLRGRLFAAYELKNWDVVWQTAKIFRDGGVPVDEALLKKWREESGRDYPK